MLLVPFFIGFKLSKYWNALGPKDFGTWARFETSAAPLIKSSSEFNVSHRAIPQVLVELLLVVYLIIWDVLKLSVGFCLRVSGCKAIGPGL